LGIAQVDAAEYAKRGSVTITPSLGEVSLSTHGPTVSVALSDAEIDGLIAARLAARKAKNWAEADRIRDQLAQAGVILEDKPNAPTTWRRA